MKIISLILKTVYTVLTGAYDLFKFLLDFPSLIADVIVVLPTPIVSLITTIFILSIAIIFLKFVK